MIEIKSQKKSFGINFPSSVNEVTPDVLNSISEGIKLPKHYCIVALAFNTKLFDFCTAIKNNRNDSVGVTPILAKISKEDSELINANVGDKIIIERSSLERGAHINLRCAISSNFARKYFNEDPELTRAIITKDNKVAIDNNINKQLIGSQSPNIIVLEFKICPVNDIYAAIPMNNETLDPFIVDYKSCD